MKIEVTQQDIDKAREMVKMGLAQSTCCPINLATERAFGDTTRTGLGLIRVGECGDAYPLPIKAREFIKAFDSGKEVAPIEFEVTRG